MSANPVTDPAEIGRRAEASAGTPGTTTRTGTSSTGAGGRRSRRTTRRAGRPPRRCQGPARLARGGGYRGPRDRRHPRAVSSRFTTGCSMSVDRIWQYHFEFLNLGYAAYLVFYELCKPELPGHPRSDDREDGQRHRRRPVPTRRRAEAAGAARARSRRRGRGPDRRRSVGARTTPWPPARPARNGWPSGRRSRRRGSSTPTATASTTTTARGSTIRPCPSPTSRAYIERLRAIIWPVHSPRWSAERDRISAEYRGLLADPGRDRGLRAEPRPDADGLPVRGEPQLLRRALVPHDLLEQGPRVRRPAGPPRLAFHPDAEDVFYLQRHEISDALVDLRLAWAAGSVGRGPGYWPPIVARRRRSWRRCATFTPPPALGSVPDTITEPMTIMLWGITTERVQEWASDSTRDGATLTGFAGSPGSARGPRA